MPWLQVTRFGLLLQCVETVGEDECEGLFSGHGVGGKKQTAIGWRVHFEFALGLIVAFYQVITGYLPEFP